MTQVTKRISIIGSGNVGHYFARTFHDVGIQIHQIFSRQIVRASALSSLVDAQAIDDLKDVNGNVDLIIIAVADDAIEGVFHQLSPLNVSLAHTSGASPSLSINGSDASAGVFYPLQTIRKEHYVFDRSMPICVTAKQLELNTKLLDLAKQVSDHVVSVSDRDRLKYHMAAVYANNFVNHLYAKVNDFLEEECLESSLLLPLIQKTFEQIGHEDLKSMQTGPAKRNDLKTQAQHLSLLNQYADESMMDLYELFSKSIKDYHSS